MQDRSEDFLDTELIARRLNARALWNQFIAGITATFACLMLFAVFLYLGYLVVFVWSEEGAILEASQVDWKVQAVAQTGRIVAIVIMIFLAQFLLTLHRYCARLSEHYFVRSCGLFLSRGEIKNLGKTVIALDADHIDQKGAPRSPVRDIGAMVEKLVAVRTDGDTK